ncbi:hypothetical protein M5E06_10400 [Azospirillum sp. A1-3]|uniref:hypothetical protein n=1 Tax=Azospirillum sp. A1-3 TaxID=185874 RepID=UPI002076EC1D|nr:hypothetical protein [Azospirillum sp. A1-3]MCM8734604.1 hypothetical protein [Azospirillum sp. A1-3]
MSAGTVSAAGRAIYCADGKMAARIRRLIVTDLRRCSALRWRIEIGMPALLLYTPVALVGGHPDSTGEQREWAGPELARLKEACNAPFLDLSDKDHEIARRLSVQVANYAMGAAAEHRERTSIWIALTTLYWLERMLDVDPDLLIENGPLHHAVYALLERANKFPDLRETFEASARKASARLGRAFTELELYRDGEGLFARRQPVPAMAAE